MLMEWKRWLRRLFVAAPHGKTSRSVLLLFCALGCCTVPRGGELAYVMYGTQYIANHSYVDVSGMGSDGSVECHSNLQTCCSAIQGPDRGDWYDPRGLIVRFPSSAMKGPYQKRLPQRVQLRCTSRKDCVSGLYRCGITVRNDGNRRVRKNFYVGLYANGGGELSIPEGISFTSVDHTHFTLSCVSSGGPATTVSWSKDSLPLSPDTHTMVSALLDPATASYAHTLTVVVREGEGEYVCTVANGRPSVASAHLLVRAPYPPPTILNVSQLGPSSLQVTWTKTSDERATVTGYIISHRRLDNDHNDIPVTVETSVTQSSFIITGLIPGATYSICLRARSHTLPSDPSAPVEVVLQIMSDESSTELNSQPWWVGQWAWFQVCLVGVALFGLCRVWGLAKILVRNFQR